MRGFLKLGCRYTYSKTSDSGKITYNQPYLQSPLPVILHEFSERLRKAAVLTFTFSEKMSFIMRGILGEHDFVSQNHRDRYKNHQSLSLTNALSYASVRNVQKCLKTGRLLPIVFGILIPLLWRGIIPNTEPHDRNSIARHLHNAQRIPSYKNFCVQTNEIAPKGR